MKRILLLSSLCLAMPLFGQGMTAHVENEEGGPCCNQRGLKSVHLVWTSPFNSTRSMTFYIHGRMLGNTTLDTMSFMQNGWINIKRDGDTGLTKQIDIQTENAFVSVESFYKQDEADVMDMLAPAFDDMLWKNELFFTEGIPALQDCAADTETAMDYHAALAVEALLDTALYREFASLDRFLMHLQKLYLQYYPE
ncbi:MAG: hypothetical protein QNK37_32325 [Acidobacteriota bacterium]|nr:hypothetical protein [Acidobacteriota bacterium]